MHKGLMIVVWLFIGMTIAYYWPVIADSTIGKLKPR